MRLQHVALQLIWSAVVAASFRPLHEEQQQANTNSTTHDVGASWQQFTLPPTVQSLAGTYRGHVLVLPKAEPYFRGLLSRQTERDTSSSSSSSRSSSRKSTGQDDLAIALMHLVPAGLSSTHHARQVTNSLRGNQISTPEQLQQWYQNATHQDVVDLEGELVIRGLGKLLGGRGRSDRDVRYSFQGIYVAALGVLQGLLTLDQPGDTTPSQQLSDGRAGVQQPSSLQLPPPLATLSPASSFGAGRPLSIADLRAAAQKLLQQAQGAHTVYASPSDILELHPPEPAPPLLHDTHHSGRHLQSTSSQAAQPPAGHQPWFASLLPPGLLREDVPRGRLLVASCVQQFGLWAAGLLEQVDRHVPAAVQAVRSIPGLSHGRRQLLGDAAPSLVPQAPDKLPHEQRTRLMANASGTASCQSQLLLQAHVGWSWQGSFNPDAQLGSLSQGQQSATAVALGSAVGTGGTSNQHQGRMNTSQLVLQTLQGQQKGHPAGMVPSTNLQQQLSNRRLSSISQSFAAAPADVALPPEVQRLLLNRSTAELAHSARWYTHLPTPLVMATVTSVDCQGSQEPLWSMNMTELALRDLWRKANSYAMVATWLGVLQSYGLVSQFKVFIEATQATAAAASLYTISAIAIFDAMSTLLHLTAALVVVDPLLLSFSILAFVNFLTFAVLEIRLVLHIWRAQRPNATWDVRQELSVLYSRFYASLMGCIVALFYLRSSPFLLALIPASFWVPQIIHSAVRNAKPPFTHQFLLAQSVAHTFPLLYTTACPVNIIGAQPRPCLAACVIGWQAAQLWVIWRQMNAPGGPRSVVPSIFLPRQYNWHRAAVPRELMHHLVSTSSTLAVGSAGRLRRLPTYLLSQLSRAGQLIRRRLGAVTGSSTTACSSISGSTGGGWGSGDPELGPQALAGVDVESGLAAIECIICMNPVPLEPHSARVVTPCNHWAHPECMRRWLAIKLECPMCRQPVPPM